jgi:formylmethanofuran dehydrogenase subunit E
LYPEIADKNQQQMKAYREMNDGDLFHAQWVHVPIAAREMPGYKSPRIACAACGEGINYDREVVLQSGDYAGQILCQGCAFPESRYYQPLSSEEAERLDAYHEGKSESQPQSSAAGSQLPVSAAEA